MSKSIELAACRDDNASMNSGEVDPIDILEAIDVPLVVVERDCKVSRFNRAAADALGASASDIGRQSCEMGVLNGSPEVEKACMQAMTDQLPSRLEIRKDDSWFHVHIAPYTRGREPEVCGAVLTFTNITAFRASLERAVHEREYTKTILNSIVDPLVMLDEAFCVQTANRAFFEWFGVSRDQLLGTSLESLGDDQWRASRLWSSLQRTIADGADFGTLECEREFPGERRRTVLIDGQRIVRAGRAFVLLSFRDISSGKAAEQALRESEARFRELYESMDALYASAQSEIESRERAETTLREINRRKDEFLAILAHELRNPLAPIRQAAAVSRAERATEEEKLWSHAVIDRQVRHMALLLDDLLDISRVTRGTLELRPRMTDVKSVIDSAIETARPLIEAKRHSLKVEAPLQPERFGADPLRLAQVLSNLLTNAAKYTDPGGEIRLCAACDLNTVIFSVRDTGIGIPPDKRAEVFAMFSQVKSAQDRSEGGLGIGLALARGLIQLHQGTLEVQSEGAGRGSEFIVTIPRRNLIDTSEERAAVIGTSTTHRRVLIADDNRDAAQSLGMLLEMDGHEVAIVHDGREAIATIESFRPEIALLDIGMPELNGYEVARHIRESPLSSSTRLIAVTGWGQDSDKVRAAAAGFDHHFTKPIEPSALIQLLRSAGG